MNVSLSTPTKRQRVQLLALVIACGFVRRVAFSRPVLLLTVDLDTEVVADFVGQKAQGFGAFDARQSDDVIQLLNVALDADPMHYVAAPQVDYV